MLKKRVIPCLDVKDGRVVKGVRFQGLRDAGDPCEQASRYECEGADEIVVLDVSATHDGRVAAVETVSMIREVVSVPLTIGGGVRSLDDALELLSMGADKVGVNTAAFDNPDLVSGLARSAGTQCVVVAIDAARVDGSGWEVVTRAGTNRTGADVIEWAQRVESLGCGEILLTSWDRDGTQSGYDLELLRAVTSAVRIPVIASGGASSAGHMAHAFDAGADAVLAASIFHDGIHTIRSIKEELNTLGTEVRL